MLPLNVQAALPVARQTRWQASGGKTHSQTSGGRVGSGSSMGRNHRARVKAAA